MEISSLLNSLVGCVVMSDDNSKLRIIIVGNNSRLARYLSGNMTLHVYFSHPLLDESVLSEVGGVIHSTWLPLSVVFAATT